MLVRGWEVRGVGIVLSWVPAFLMVRPSLLGSVWLAMATAGSEGRPREAAESAESAD